MVVAGGAAAVVVDVNTIYAFFVAVAVVVVKINAIYPFFGAVGSG